MGDEELGLNEEQTREQNTLFYEWKGYLSKLSGLEFADPDTLKELLGENVFRKLDGDKQFHKLFQEMMKRYRLLQEVSGEGEEWTEKEPPAEPESGLTGEAYTKAAEKYLSDRKKWLRSRIKKLNKETDPEKQESEIESINDELDQLRKDLPTEEEEKVEPYQGYKFSDGIANKLAEKMKKSFAAEARDEALKNVINIGKPRDVGFAVYDDMSKQRSCIFQSLCSYADENKKYNWDQSMVIEPLDHVFICAPGEQQPFMLNWDKNRTKFEVGEKKYDSHAAYELDKRRKPPKPPEGFFTGLWNRISKKFRGKPSKPFRKYAMEMARYQVYMANNTTYGKHVVGQWKKEDNFEERADLRKVLKNLVTKGKITKWDTEITAEDTASRAYESVQYAMWSTCEKAGNDGLMKRDYAASLFWRMVWERLTPDDGPVLEMMLKCWDHDDPEHSITKRIWENDRGNFDIDGALDDLRATAKRLDKLPAENRYTSPGKRLNDNLDRFKAAMKDRYKPDSEEIKGLDDFARDVRYHQYEGTRFDLPREQMEQLAYCSPQQLNELFKVYKECFAGRENTMKWYKEMETRYNDRLNIEWQTADLKDSDTLKEIEYRWSYIFNDPNDEDPWHDEYLNENSSNRRVEMIEERKKDAEAALAKFNEKAAKFFKTNRPFPFTSSKEAAAKRKADGISDVATPMLAEREEDAQFMDTDKKLGEKTKSKTRTTPKELVENLRDSLKKNLYFKTFASKEKVDQFLAVFAKNVGCKLKSGEDGKDPKVVEDKEAKPDAKTVDRAKALTAAITKWSQEDQYHLYMQYLMKPQDVQRVLANPSLKAISAAKEASTKMKKEVVVIPKYQEEQPVNESTVENEHKKVEEKPTVKVHHVGP